MIPNRHPPVASGGQDIGNLYAVDAQDKDAPEVCYGTGFTGRVLSQTASHLFTIFFGLVKSNLRSICFLVSTNQFTLVRHLTSFTLT